MLALVFAAVAAATPAPAPTATPLATAQELYEGAIARLAHLHQAPYLAYEMDQVGYARSAGVVFDRGERIIERRADRAFHNVMLYGGTLSIGRHYLTPDEFIPNVSASPATDGVDPMLDTPIAAATPAPVAAGAPAGAPSVKTIATVSTTTSYDLAYVADETIKDGFCHEAAHITLVPKRDSDVFNVRDVWIRRSDFALCAAIFNSWTFSGDGHFRTHDAVWLDERGFIRAWRSEMIDQPDSYDAGSFKDVTWQDSVPGGTYFSH